MGRCNLISYISWGGCVTLHKSLGPPPCSADVDLPTVLTRRGETCIIVHVSHTHCITHQGPIHTRAFHKCLLPGRRPRPKQKKLCTTMSERKSWGFLRGCNIEGWSQKVDLMTNRGKHPVGAMSTLKIRAKGAQSSALAVFDLRMRQTEMAKMADFSPLLPVSQPRGDVAPLNRRARHTN